MSRAAEAISDRASGQLHVAAIASEAHVSQSHFRRLFRETYGESAGRMHRRARFRRACEMLAYGGMTVSETAYGLGFSTVQNFSRFFKINGGVSPREYRRGTAVGQRPGDHGNVRS